MLINRMPYERALAGALTLATCLAGSACDRRHREAPPSTPLPPLGSAGSGSSGVATDGGQKVAGCNLAPMPAKLPLSPKRLVAIGDLHGDLGGTRSALKAAGAIDGNDQWIGGDLVIVQTGDILDRGDDESKIYALFEKLEADAVKAGGAIVLLDGNHELMNAARDFRYVTPGAMADFGGDRQKAFDPGGLWAKKIARSNIVAIVADTVFSHAGVLPEWVTQVDALNLSARCWLDGQAGSFQQPPPALTSDTSPLWNRDYGLPDAVDCASLSDVLQKLGAKRMVVGHTVQPGGITSACDGKLWRIDVGLAAGYGGPIEVLEVVGGTGAPRVLRGSRGG
jgi:hypothetical protein